MLSRWTFSPFYCFAICQSAIFKNYARRFWERPFNKICENSLLERLKTSNLCRWSADGSMRNYLTPQKHTRLSGNPTGISILFFKALEFLSDVVRIAATELFRKMWQISVVFSGKTWQNRDEIIRKTLQIIMIFDQKTWLGKENSQLFEIF